MFVADLGVGLTTALLIGALLKNTQTKSSGAYALISHRLALLSYTLYVVHAPFLVFMRNAFVRKPLNPTLASVPLVLTIAVLGLLYASVVWWAAEARTDDVREMIGPQVGYCAGAPKGTSSGFSGRRPGSLTATHRLHRSAGTCADPSPFRNPSCSSRNRNRFLSPDRRNPKSRPHPDARTRAGSVRVARPRATA